MALKNTPSYRSNPIHKTVQPKKTTKKNQERNLKCSEVKWMGLLCVWFDCKQIICTCEECHSLSKRLFTVGDCVDMGHLAIYKPVWLCVCVNKVNTVNLDSSVRQTHTNTSSFSNCVWDAHHFHNADFWKISYNITQTFHCAASFARLVWCVSVGVFFRKQICHAAWQSSRRGEAICRKAHNKQWTLLAVCYS